jgi:hypothetical protein
MLENLKAIFKSLREYYKKKKDEKRVGYMQAAGRTMVKTNWMDHSYMRSPVQQMGLDKGVKMGSSQFGNDKKI